MSLPFARENTDTDATVINAAATNTLNIGEGNNGTSFGGTIGEILIFNNSMTDAERLEVENYLIKKWNVTGF